MGGLRVALKEITQSPGQACSSYKPYLTHLVSEFGKMEQAWDLFGDNEGAVQSLGSNINSAAFLHSRITLTCPRGWTKCSTCSRA